MDGVGKRTTPGYPDRPSRARRGDPANRAINHYINANLYEMFRQLASSRGQTVSGRLELLIAADVDSGGLALDGYLLDDSRKDHVFTSGGETRE